jgi:hypothetical protein
MMDESKVFAGKCHDAETQPQLRFSTPQKLYLEGIEHMQKSLTKLEAYLRRDKLIHNLN